jgi:cytochrome c oxidase cbb3-type subunit 3
MCSHCLKVAIVALVAMCLVSACTREERRFAENPGASATPQSIALSTLQPGTATPSQSSPYEYNAYAIAQGKQLFEWFNCSGCHAQGGGAIGPALMDTAWIYGNEPQNIFATIVEGRPNGMPSFRGRITTQQVWQLVAYVRSLSGEVSKDAAPSRSDHLFTKKSEQSTAELKPTDRSAPPAPPQ